jgi:hypothetical protein
MVEIPAKKRFLFGDQIIYRVKIKSLLKFDKVRVEFEKKGKPDYLFYKFGDMEYKDDYRTKGKIIFQFFRTGKIRLPKFTILLLKKTKEGEIEFFKKNFEGLTFNFISVLKGDEKISQPIPPETSYFLLLIILMILIIAFILLGFIFKKRDKKEKRINPLLALKKRLKPLKKRKEISYDKELFFDTGKILRDALSLLNGEDFNSLTVKEMEKIVNSETDYYEINKKGVEILKKIEIQKFGNYEMEREIIEKALSLVENIIKKIKNV